MINICLANSNFPQTDNPPAYAPPEGPYYMTDVPYGVPPPGYYGWMPSTAAFPDAPPCNNIYIFFLIVKLVTIVKICFFFPILIILF